MPGFVPSFDSGLGVTTFVWLIAIIVVIGIVWRGRKNSFVSGTLIVLKRFRIDGYPSAKTVVEVSGRASGIVSWVLTLLKLNPEIELIVTDSEVTIRLASLSGIQYTYVPLGKITASVCGYQRSIVAFGFAVLFSVGFVMNLLSGFLGNNRFQTGSDMGLAFGFLILACIAALFYFLSKRIGIFVESSIHAHGVVFKRSVIENVSVDLPQALEAVSLINARILAAQTGQTPSTGSALSPSSPRTAPTPSPTEGGRGLCPKCSTVNPIDVRFCENCGFALPS